MRARLILFLAAFTVLPATAMAGNFVLNGDRGAWQSTACTEPATPPALSSVSSESSASDMNKLMEIYNVYADSMQGYMDCLNKEAETDTQVVNQTIIATAKNLIDSAQQKVEGFHTTLQAKQSD